MERIDIVFNDTRQSLTLNLERRITYITGLSGKGKSTLVSLLNVNDLERVSASSTLPVVIATRDVIDYFVNIRDSILVLDDIYSLQSTSFMKQVKENAVKNNVWLLVVGREDIKEHGISLPVSFSSVYEMSIDDDEWSLSKLHIPDKVLLDGIKLDKVFVEDEKSGFNFAKKLCRNYEVETLRGASNLVKRLVSMQESGITNMSMFVFVDMASFGIDFITVKNLLSQRGYYGFSLYLMSDYECFEELLLRSNLLNCIVNLQDEIDSHANDYISWEGFFEALLDKITSGKLYRAYHSSMTDCYLQDCCYLNENQGGKCEFYNSVTGDKIEFLLDGTKYARLLSLYKV